MSGLNEVRVRGRVLRDADAFRGGKVADVLYFTLAVPAMDGRGQDVYVDCVAFPPQYDDFDGLLEKDEIVEVHGGLIYRTWTDMKGQRKSGVEVCATTVIVEEEDEDVD